ncbi:hypothetical protein D3C72_1202490 [compost metagenome]
MFPELFPTITPSITHKGSVLPFTVVLPRIIIFPTDPGWPPPVFTKTPVAFPASIFSTAGVVISTIFLLSKV